MSWNDLTLSDKARMIQLAVNSGITDLKTIHEVYNTYAEGGPIELPFSYKKLSRDWKTRIDRLAKEHGVNPTKIERYYNEGRLTPLIGAYYTLKDSGRQRLNDTRTAEESMKHTTNSNKVMYGNVIKDPKTPSNNPQSGNPNFDAMVPYISDKEVRVLGNRVSTNLFDSLAVRVPKVKNASMQDAVGIVFQETGGGSVPWGNTNKTKDENTALLNGNYWREYGWMPAEYFGRDYRYNLEEHEISRNTHPFEHMLQYFEAGKYNPGDPNHTSDVRNKGKEVMNTPAFKEWEKTSPYAKKIRMYHKYGGALKLMTNL